MADTSYDASIAITPYAGRLSSENPGLEVTRALAAKALLTQALDAVEGLPKHRGK